MTAARDELPAGFDLAAYVDQLGVEWTAPCDVRIPGELEALFGQVQERWGGLDFLLHSIAFAPKSRRHLISTPSTSKPLRVSM